MAVASASRVISGGEGNGRDFFVQLLFNSNR